MNKTGIAWEHPQYENIWQLCQSYRGINQQQTQ